MRGIKDKKLNYLGTGLEWDAHLEEQLWAHLGELDCLEIIPENFYFGGRLQMVDSLVKIREANTPVLIHGVELSIGSSDTLKKDHLDKMKRVMDQVNCVCYSEHLSMVDEGGVEIGQLTPLPWSNNLADRVSEKIEQIQKEIKSFKVPFIIENITNRFVFPKTKISETAFINRILQNTGCQMLLDVTNVFTNSFNHQYDPYEWIDAIDHKYISQIHLAGGQYDEDGVLQDSHDNSVFEESWKLYQYAINELGPITTIVERTGNIPDISFLLSEMRRAKNIIMEEKSKVDAYAVKEVRSKFKQDEKYELFKYADGLNSTNKIARS